MRGAGGGRGVHQQLSIQPAVSGAGGARPDLRPHGERVRLVSFASRDGLTKLNVTPPTFRLGPSPLTEGLTLIGQPLFKHVGAERRSLTVISFLRQAGGGEPQTKTSLLHFCLLNNQLHPLLPSAGPHRQKDPDKTKKFWFQERLGSSLETRSHKSQRIKLRVTCR